MLQVFWRAAASRCGCSLFQALICPPSNSFWFLYSFLIVLVEIKHWCVHMEAFCAEALWRSESTSKPNVLLTMLCLWPWYDHTQSIIDRPSAVCKYFIISNAPKRVVSHVFYWGERGRGDSWPQCFPNCLLVSYTASEQSRASVIDHRRCGQLSRVPHPYKHWGPLAKQCVKIHIVSCTFNFD